MSTGTEDFEKLRKLLKLKRHEQPPPGYFSRFSSLVINRLEKEGRPEDLWAEVPWLGKLLKTFESSPVVAGLFGSALCALVIFGITVANQVDKAPASFSLVPAGTADASPKDSALASLSGNSPSEAFGRSTDPMFGSNGLASPFGGNGGSGSMTASLEPVSFSTSH